MINLKFVKEVYVFSGVTDFRNGIHGLLRIISRDFDLNNIKDCIFIFCNSKRSSIKLLEKDSTGIWIYQKKLDRGKFIFPKTQQNARITVDELKILINGLDFIRIIEKNEKNLDFL